MSRLTRKIDIALMLTFSALAATGCGPTGTTPTAPVATRQQRVSRWYRILARANRR